MGERLAGGLVFCFFCALAAGLVSSLAEATPGVELVGLSLAAAVCVGSGLVGLGIAVVPRQLARVSSSRWVRAHLSLRARAAIALVVTGPSLPGLWLSTLRHGYYHPRTELMDLAVLGVTAGFSLVVLMAIGVVTGVLRPRPATVVPGRRAT